MNAPISDTSHKKITLARLACLCLILSQQDPVDNSTLYSRVVLGKYAMMMMIMMMMLMMMMMLVMLMVLVLVPVMVIVSSLKRFLWTFRWDKIIGRINEVNVRRGSTV